MDRNLDGVYFRVRRNGNFKKVCFSDLTHTERESVCAGRDSEWFKAMAYYLADRLKDVGDTFDIVGKE